MQKIWNIPPQTHRDLIPLLSGCLPLLDEICQRLIRFARTCLFHESNLIRFVASHGILHSRGFSFLGRNFSFCMNRYNMSVNDIFSGTCTSRIHAFIRKSLDVSIIGIADFLVETLKLRSGLLELPDNEQSLIMTDINHIVSFICTA